MSLGEDTSEYVVNKSQGKIHTENADLISLLTENSSESLIRKPVIHRSTGRASTVKSKLDSPLDVNNNSKTEEDDKLAPSGSDIDSNWKTPESRVSADKDNFPKPKPSALLPSARGPSADIKDIERTSSSSVYAVANPDILRASGITPVQPNQYFPRYVSIKSKSQTTPQTSASVDVSATPVAEEESEEDKTPRTSSRAEVASPEKESLVVPEVKSERKSPAVISADSLEFNDCELDKYLTSGPSAKATTENRPEEHSSPRPPSIVIQEDTFEKTSEQKKTVPVDKNLLQAPSVKSGHQSKSRNPQSPEGFERDSLSSSVEVGEEEKESARVSDSAASGRSKVFIVRNDSESTMSAARNRKVYVESPTFTKDEEDEYRFVSSRIDDYNEMTDTYRQLDENTLEQKPKKKSSGKRVRYQDSERFEDKNQLDLDEDARSGHRSGLSYGHDVTYKSALKNPSRQEPVQSPSKGLTIPDTPQDPKEKEELEREVQYQDTLKRRIDDGRRQLESEDIPRLPLSPDTNRDFMVDSLDMAGETYRQNRGSRARDSLELYQGATDRSGRYGEMENTSWRNPPPQPFSAPPYEENEGNSGPFQNVQRQNAMDGYASEPDYRQRREEYGYPEPPSEQRGFQRDPPQAYQNQQMDHPGEQRGFQRDPPQAYQNHQMDHPNDQRGYQRDPHVFLNHQMDHPNDQRGFQRDPQVSQTHQLAHPSYQTHPQYYQDQSQGQPNYPSPQQIQDSGYYDNSQGYAQRNPHISSFLPEDRGINQSYDSEASYRPTYNEHYQNNQNGGYGYYDNGNGENGPYDNRSEVTGGYSNPQRHVDRFVNENVEPRLEMANPSKPNYNYVSNNKIDYGRQPPKSYKQILDIKNEEKARLETIFVKPKVKPKHAPPHNTSARTVNSDEGALEAYHRPVALNQKPASAEDLWAQRAASLQQRSAGKQSTKKKPKGKLVKYPSDSGISPPQLNSRIPLPRPAFLPGAGNSPPHHNTSAPNSFPSSPVRHPLELKPISQEVITSGGQRISVDVNLKLMSPPPPHYHSDGNLPGHTGSHAGGHAHMQDVFDVAQQYPALDYHSQQDYPETYSDLMPVGGGQQGYEPIARQPREDRESFSNAYPKIPPIPSSGQSKQSHQTGEIEDGYVAQFRKQKEKREYQEKPWYKVYGINDYRKMQKEVQLGTLGPDLDNATYKERLEKVQRQSQYARMVMDKNKQIPHKKPPSFPKPKDQDDIMNKRKVAIEYAKTVPKPNTKLSPNPYNSYEVASQISGGGPSSRQHYKQPVVDVIDLDKLQQRHERDKQNVAKIRQNMDSVVAQNA